MFSAATDDPSAKELGQQLTSLGTSALPTLFDSLRDGTYRVKTEESLEVRTLSLEETNAVLSAIGHIPTASLESFLRERTTLEPTPENRRTALRVLAPIARDNDLTFCMQLAEPLTPEGQVDTAAAVHLQRCLVNMLSESETVFRRLLAVFKRAHLDLRPTIVLAVTEVGTDAGFEALSEFLSTTEHLESFILSSMSRVARTISLPIDKMVAARIRKLERSSDVKLVREALLLLGRVEDADSVPRMIARLSDTDDSVRAAAHWSLKHLSGLKLRDEPRRWTMWHANEIAWWQVHAPQVLTSLRSSQVRERKRAIAILSQRRLRQNRVARDLMPLLSDSDEGVIALAIRALSILDAKVAAPKIERLLEHRSDEVRKQATAALARW